MVNRAHGGRLQRRTANERTRERILSEAEDYPVLEISASNAVDLENIATGVLSPLDGFMMSDQLQSVLANMRLPDDIPWTIPVVLDINEDVRAFDEGDTILLCEGGETLGRMHVDDIYSYDKREYCRSVFGTEDPDHPGVASVKEMGHFLVGGEIDLLKERENPFRDYYLTPTETRILFRERGWDTVVAFQTRNVAHVGHEFLQKTAAVFADGLFVNPVIGKKKVGDFRDDVILHSYDVLLKHYYPREISHLSILNYEMKYAGPKEAIHHAIMRKNFGCTHIIIGRDHAGVGNYYGPFEAQEIFREFPDLGMEPVTFQFFFHCRKCMNIVNSKICPHGPEDHESLSGTKMREMIVSGEAPPPHLMRPEVFEAIREFENPFVE